MTDCNRQDIIRVAAKCVIDHSLNENQIELRTAKYIRSVFMTTDRSLYSQ